MKGDGTSTDDTETTEPTDNNNIIATIPRKGIPCVLNIEMNIDINGQNVIWREGSVNDVNGNHNRDANTSDTNATKYTYNFHHGPNE